MDSRIRGVRLVGAAALFALVTLMPGVAWAQEDGSVALRIPSVAVPVIDGMVFPSEASSGVSIERTHVAGPMFTLSARTTVTEIGAFINHYQGTAPMWVGVVGATDGLPDLHKFYGLFVLSGRPDFYTYSYASASMRLTLKPGSYFALFATTGDDRAVILGASGTFRAGAFLTGAVDLTGATPPSAQGQYVAVRIAGEPR